MGIKMVTAFLGLCGAQCLSLSKSFSRRWCNRLLVHKHACSCGWDATDRCGAAALALQWRSPSVPAAISLSAAPMGHTSDSTAVLMLLLHTVYIYSQLALPLWGTWMSCVLCEYQCWGGGGREGGKRGPNRPAMLPLPRILSANGSAGIWGGGWRWTETDGSWQTHTDSQWIQGSLAERSEQGWIKDRLTFKVSPRLVPPHCQRRERERVYGSSVGFSVKLAGRPRAYCLVFTRPEVSDSSQNHLHPTQTDSCS